MEIEPARVLRGTFDRAIHVEFLRHAFARKAPELAQRNLDVARIELDVAVEVAKVALVPNPDGAAVAALATDPHAFRVVAVRAERARAVGADPFRAAGVTLTLFFESLFESFHQLVPAAQRFDSLLVLIREQPLEFFAQPRLGNRRANIEDCVHTLEVRRKREVVAVELRLVLD